MQQAQDFYDESAALAELIAPLSETDLKRETLFKCWTINEILRHLHVWNIAAACSIEGEEAFGRFMQQLTRGKSGRWFTDYEAAYLEGLSGHALVAAWRRQYETLTTAFRTVDPKTRLKWVGPDMSALSSVTARLMETWAHAQAVYDILGVDRIDTDRIGNIVRLGVNTYDWTFRNRKEEPPGPMPRLRLKAPSGSIWEYGADNDEGGNLIEGNASEFCQVVTQCRNISDTALSVHGPAATRWMAVAQCFAGPPNDPPQAGTRRRA
ncbi:MAG: TIGR03084 family metal-binding protein [Sphingorhabdus sp.]